MTNRQRAVIDGAPSPTWQPMDTAPDDGDFYLYGVNVTNNKTGAKWFEVWYLARDDEGHMIDPSGDYFSEWSHDDFECWAKAPAPVSSTPRCTCAAEVNPDIPHARFCAAPFCSPQETEHE